jgi:hypothetical protein
LQTKDEFFRAQADACAELAERAPDPGTKAVYEEMSATWRRLFELAKELQSKQHPDGD